MSFNKMLLERLTRGRWRRRLPPRVARRARVIGGAVEAVSLVDTGQRVPPDRVTLERDGSSSFRVSVDFNRFFPRRRWAAQEFLPTPLAFFSLTDPKLQRLEADLSDGEQSGPGIASFSSACAHSILVPDPDFMNTFGYRSFRRPGFDPDGNWWQRSDSVLWRGAPTGRGTRSSAAMRPEGLIPRVAMCLMLRGVAGVDARIAPNGWSESSRRDHQRFRAAGILAERANPLIWVGCRYALDIDGYTNAWSNLFTRLLTGNCVIKVASPGGYRQWYYDRLEAGVHYVPVRADMSDLVETIEWCRSHPGECFRIARAGRSLALSLKFESETAAAVERLNAALAA